MFRSFRWIVSSPFLFPRRRDLSLSVLRPPAYQVPSSNRIGRRPRAHPVLSQRRKSPRLDSRRSSWERPFEEEQVAPHGLGSVWNCFDHRRRGLDPCCVRRLVRTLSLARLVLFSCRCSSSSVDSLIFTSASPQCRCRNRCRKTQRH